MTVITLATLSTPTGRMRLAATDSALVLSDWPDVEGADRILSKIQKRLEATLNDEEPQDATVIGHPVLRQTAHELQEYFVRKRRVFSLPLKLAGTPFQISVWKALLTVPYGETISYGMLANRIGHPRAVRAVAQAVGANPLGIILPCHRIIGSDGSLTGFGGGLDRKVLLLGLEKG